MKIHTINHNHWTRVYDFGDVVYVRYSYRKDCLCLLKKDAERLNLESEDIYAQMSVYGIHRIYHYSDESLNEYRRKRLNTTLPHNDPFEYLEREDYSNIYLGHPSWDGLLYFLDESPVPKNAECRWYEDEVACQYIVRALRQLPGWIDIEYTPDYADDGYGRVEATRILTTEEFAAAHKEHGYNFHKAFENIKY